MCYKGSREVVEREHRLVFIMRETIAVMANQFTAGLELDVTDDRFCVVKRGDQAVTCHAGECGHHVHIRWRV